MICAYYNSCVNPHNFYCIAFTRSVVHLEEAIVFGNCDEPKKYSRERILIFFSFFYKVKNVWKNIPNYGIDLMISVHTYTVLKFCAS